MFLLSYSSTYRRTGRPFHCFWGDSPGWHCVGGLLKQGSSAVAKLLQSLVTVRKVGRQVGIGGDNSMTGEHQGTVWAPVGEDGGHRRDLFVRVCVCLFECAHIYMLGTRQTGMTPSGAHAWPSVSLLYITWHIVQKVVWRQCHPVQLNVSNVTYTGSSQTHTHIHTLCYSWSFLPSRLFFFTTV